MKFINDYTPGDYLFIKDLSSMKVLVVPQGKLSAPIIVEAFFAEDFGSCEEQLTYAKEDRFSSDWFRDWPKNWWWVPWEDVLNNIGLPKFE